MSRVIWQTRRVEWEKRRRSSGSGIGVARAQGSNCGYGPSKETPPVDWA
ncbi:MAG: hypothetical protein R2827_01805 [Bdellovibrionales bacterium]